MATSRDPGEPDPGRPHPGEPDPGTLEPGVLGSGMPDYLDEPPPEFDLTDQLLAEDPFKDWELFLAYDSCAAA
ncbi:hypothetical protein D9M72_532620 [compost metagenome]